MKRFAFALILSFLMLTPSVLSIGISYTEDTVQTTIANDTVDYTLWLSGDEGDEVLYSFDFGEVDQHVEEYYTIPSDGIKEVTQTIDVPDQSGTYEVMFLVKESGGGGGQSSISSEVYHSVDVEVSEATCEDMDCGEDSYTSWEKYCDGDVVKRRRTYYDAGCQDLDCYNISSEETEVVEDCLDICEDDECIVTEEDNGNGGSGGDGIDDTEDEDTENDTTTDNNTTDNVTDDNVTDNVTGDNVTEGDEIDTLSGLRDVVTNKTQFVKIADSMGYNKDEILNFLSERPYEEEEEVEKEEDGGWLWYLIPVVGSVILMLILWWRRNRSVQL